MSRYLNVKFNHKFDQYAYADAMNEIDSMIKKLHVTQQKLSAATSVKPSPPITNTPPAKKNSINA